MNLKYLYFAISLLIATSLSAAERPNILVILADDLGYSDLGCYGGEIQTPHIDALAQGGVRFTQLYNSARCCPSRASLMTGLYPSQAGIGDFTTARPDPKRGPGYLGRLNDQCVTLAEVLKPAGYGCYYVGKWHMHPETGPIQRGFDEFYGYTNDHSHDQYDAGYYVRLPQGRAKEIDPPADQFYATDVFNDYALEFIKQGQRSDQPWFLFLGHSSPHFPVQAPAERADKYDATYLRGWDVLREERFARMQKLGLINGSQWKLPPRSLVPVDRDDIANGFSGEPNPAWNSLDEARQRDLARRMAVFAAMVESIDEGVGRIVEHLKATDELNNTLILFLSDNGACYEWGPFGFDGVSRKGTTTLRVGDEVRDIGGRGTHQSYGSGWANLGNTPLRLYKHFTHEGGISTPFIAHWPQGIGRPDHWVRDPAHVMDILPTVLEVAGARYPTTFGDRKILPAEGTSLLLALRGERLPARGLGFDHQGARAWREGDWKLVWSKRMPHEIQWELYNLAVDRCELTDLAQEYPERVEEMAAAWEKWARRVGVIWEPSENSVAVATAVSTDDVPKPLEVKPRLSADTPAQEPAAKKKGKAKGKGAAKKAEEKTAAEKGQAADPQPPREKPFQSHLITKWGAEVTAENAWTEYPRPQMKRDHWQNLNGRWDYAITPVEHKEKPNQWSGKILVPFCLEAKLGGVQRLLDASEALWYRRTFQGSPADGTRQLLNFEAVDYRCEAFVNGKSVGKHQGGNTPFSFDITEALKEGENELLVRVEDDTEAFQLRGKQTLNPRGIWYTQVSGIWQTVWLEPVPQTYIEDLGLTTRAKSGEIVVSVDVKGELRPQQIRVTVRDGDAVVGQVTSAAVGEGLTVKIPQAKLWSPASPHLYDVQVELLDDNDRVLDHVQSYAGVRDVGKIKDAAGHWRFTLNGDVIFHWGPLDQGWWPDGLLTPPSDEAMLYDIEWLKSAGFNMIRKHIKVEPRRYYYHCDRLGMMVWQDQVSGGPQPEWTRLVPNPKDAEWPDDQHDQFMYELDQMIDTLENHPSIVVWVPFNEAWGQHRTVEVGKWTAQRDATRLVNIASGGNFWSVGDIVDAHAYPHPQFPFDQNANGRFDDFIKVMGEFGGHGYPVREHLWDANRRNWGYGGLPQNEAEYKERYVTSLKMLNDLRGQGIAAGVYTQTTDVEGEINGLLTYDRKVIKIPAKELAELHQQLFQPVKK